MSMRTILFFWPILFTWILALAGCETNPFSGSAAMRIDVEVYKGPLSEEPEAQLRDLWGLILQTERWLGESDNFTRAIFANQGFAFSAVRHSVGDAWPLPRIDEDGKTVDKVKATGVPTTQNNSGGCNVKKGKNESAENDCSSPASNDTDSNKGMQEYSVDNICYEVRAESSWYDFRFWRLFGILDTLDHYNCFALVSLIKDLDLALKMTKDITAGYKTKLVRGKQTVSTEDVQPFLQEIVTLSGYLKFLALRWSIATGGGHSFDTRIRLAHINAIVTTSEAANQLNARADALLKQLAPYGLDRRELPPGVALRETQPTDFVHLYEWLNASAPAELNKFFGIGSAAERVKAIERLFVDQYWAKTNTVYASGRGKVAMAFIKDDVGNWSLKSFDNSPEELLKAYADFSVETIRKALEVAAKAAGNAAAAGSPEATQTAAKLLSLAATTAFGSRPSDSPSKESNTLVPLRQNLILQLKEKKIQCEKNNDSAQDRLKECLNDIQTLLKEYSNTVDRIATGMASSR